MGLARLGGHSSIANVLQMPWPRIRVWSRYRIMRDEVRPACLLDMSGSFGLGM
jgi:hypothetical protein